MRDVANKQDQIIDKVENNYWKTSHKLGIRIPKTVDEVLNTDKETGTEFWEV